MEVTIGLVYILS